MELNNLSESRFEVINKTPSVHSNVHKVQSFDFSKQSARTTGVFGAQNGGDYYNPNKDFTMQRLDKSVPNYKKDALKRSSLNNSVFGSEPSCMDFDAAIESKTNKLKPKT